MELAAVNDSLWQGYVMPVGKLCQGYAVFLLAAVSCDALIIIIFY